MTKQGPGLSWYPLLTLKCLEITNLRSTPTLHFFHNSYILSFYYFIISHSFVSIFHSYYNTCIKRVQKSQSNFKGYKNLEFVLIFFILSKHA